MRSANDKEVLDAAYIDNAKPDKQARQDIVAKVSMSEKEVQVRSIVAPIQQT